MKTLGFVGIVVAFWVLLNLLLSALQRAWHRRPPPKREVMEDMMNDGCQTSIRLVLTGVAGIGCAIGLALLTGWL